MELAVLQGSMATMEVLVSRVSSEKLLLIISILLFNLNFNFQDLTADTVRKAKFIFLQKSKLNFNIAGRAGIDGRPGSNGINGVPGLDGTPGTKGDKGVQGPRGNKGKEGLPGPNGNKGSPGKDGKHGTPGTCVYCLKKTNETSPYNYWLSPQIPSKFHNFASLTSSF